jgi:hypothetical protein
MELQITAKRKTEMKKYGLPFSHTKTSNLDEVKLKRGREKFQNYWTIFSERVS